MGIRDLWESILDLFGWGAEELEAEAYPAEIVDSVDVTLDDLREWDAVLTSLAESLDMTPEDLAKEDESLIIEIVEDWRAQVEYEMDVVARLEDEADEWEQVAAELGAMTPEEIDLAREMYYNQTYEMAAIFESEEEAIEYLEGVSPGVLEILQGADGLYYVYRVYAGEGHDG